MVKAAIPLILAGASVVQGVQSFMAAGEQADAAKRSQRFETQQLEMQVQRERTQAALEAQEREDRLRRALASQRAAAGSSVDVNSGSPLRLQESTIGSINREQSIADFNTADRILNLNVQTEQANIRGAAAVGAARNQQFQAVTGTITNAYRGYSMGKSLLPSQETWANGDSFR